MTQFMEDAPVTTQWYRITWEDAHGNIGTVERSAEQAARYVASLFATPGCDLKNMTEVES